MAKSMLTGHAHLCTRDEALACARTPPHNRTSCVFTHTSTAARQHSLLRSPSTHVYCDAALPEGAEVLGEESQQKGEYRGFVRWARFEKFDGVIEVLWILREDDSIAGFYVRPAERPQS